jgi:hypothetical protein
MVDVHSKGDSGMQMRKAFLFLAAITVFAVTTILAWTPPAPQAAGMTFFITSAGSGNGANLGGLAGADAICQRLAQAAGSPATRTWRAYLSANPAGQPAVNARDRIGRGPWVNSMGATIAANVDALHSEMNGMTKATNLTEKGTTVNGVGDTPNTHDILTGSQADGRAFTDGMDHTCSNWTSGADPGVAQLGHSDRMGRGATGTSWNFAHASRGCATASLAQSGGAGLFYCFATN